MRKDAEPLPVSGPSIPSKICSWIRNWLRIELPTWRTAAARGHRRCRKRRSTLARPGGLDQLQELTPEEVSQLGLTMALPETGAVRPTLLIGLGSMGRRALMELRCRLLDRFGDLDKVPLFRFLYIDTDADACQASPACRSRTGLQEPRSLPPATPAGLALSPTVGLSSSTTGCHAKSCSPSLGRSRRRARGPWAGWPSATTTSG